MTVAELKTWLDRFDPEAIIKVVVQWDEGAGRRSCSTVDFDGGAGVEYLRNEGGAVLTLGSQLDEPF